MSRARCRDACSCSLRPTAASSTSSSFRRAMASCSSARILAPLEPFREQLLLLDGLSMGVTELGPGNEHQRGMASWLTGWPNNDGQFLGGSMSGTSGWATSASIDQLIAQREAGSTPLPSLELGVRVEGSNNRHRMSYSGPELPVAPDSDPRSVYRRLFGTSTVELEGQICIADQLAQQYRSLAGRVSAADRARLEGHLSGIEGLEQRLQGSPRLRNATRSPGSRRSSMSKMKLATPRSRSFKPISWSPRSAAIPRALLRSCGLARRPRFCRLGWTAGPTPSSLSTPR